MNAPRHARQLRFSRIATHGYQVSVRVGFGFPEFSLGTMPVAWTSHYDQHAFFAWDPLLKWAYANSGAMRWSAVDLDDPKGVLTAAAHFGLAFGAVAAVGGTAADPLRSFAITARSDREHTDAEIVGLQRTLEDLHAAPDRGAMERILKEPLG